LFQPFSVQALRAESIRYVVAPYEADAQLAYLCREGIVDAALSEDSDLLPYGCGRVLYKFEKGGMAQQIMLSDLERCESLSFVNWTHDMVR
jgi:exonuclease 1